MDNPPKETIYKDQMTSKDIDRSFGNSPCFFYNNIYEVVESEDGRKVREGDSRLDETE